MQLIVTVRIHSVLVRFNSWSAVHFVFIPHHTCMYYVCYNISHIGKFLLLNVFADRCAALKIRTHKCNDRVMKGSERIKCLAMKTIAIMCLLYRVGNVHGQFKKKLAGRYLWSLFFSCSYLYSLTRSFIICCQQGSSSQPSSLWALVLSKVYARVQYTTISLVR